MSVIFPKGTFNDMAKGKKIKETTIENFYELKIKETDELVAALKGEAIEGDAPTTDIAEITGEAPSKRGQKNFDPYKIDKFSRIPPFIKAFFIKWWFAGCVCYFLNMGLGVYVTDELDLLVLTGIVCGIIVDLLVNSIFRMMESDKKEYNVYMMFPFPIKQFWTFFANMIYYVIVIICVGYAYTGINVLLNLAMTPDAEYQYLAIEPLLFGLLVFIIDMAFIGIKDGVVVLIRKLRKKEAVPDV